MHTGLLRRNMPSSLGADAPPPLVIERLHDHGVVEFRLNRPRFHNAFNTAMYDAAASLFLKHSKQPSTKIIVLTAEGPSFCSGMDIREASHPQASREVVSAAGRFMISLLQCPCIVIAAVAGPVTGIGLTLLLHCDMVYASATSTFQTPFAEVGIVPEFASSFLFPRVLGNTLTSRLLLRGDRVTAQDLQKVGCVQITDTVPDPEALHHALSWSRQVDGAQWRGVLSAKQLLRQPIRKAINAAIQREFNVISKLLDEGSVQGLMSSKLKSLRSRANDKARASAKL